MWQRPLRPPALDALAAHHVENVCITSGYRSQRYSNWDHSERAFVTFCGHLEELTVEEIIARIPGPVGVYLVLGLFLLPKIDLPVRCGFQTCRERRCKTCLTRATTAGWTDESVQGIRGLLKWVDVSYQIGMKPVLYR